MRVDTPGAMAGARADAAVTAVAGAALAVRAADCATVVFLAEGAFGVAHAGWRGLVGGVLDATVDALADLASGSIAAHLGPCIHAECYEFGGAELDVVRNRFGAEAVGETTWGTPALDLPALVGLTLRRRGVTVDRSASVCTACSERHFSHRARNDVGRHAAIAWIEP